MFGSLTTRTMRSLTSIERSSRRMSAVWTMRSPAAVATLRPSSFRSRSDRSSAPRSITPSRRASVLVSDTLSRTARSGHTAFRCRVSAIVRANAAASWTTLASIAESARSPPSLTGWAAPISVPGAIAATPAASVTNIPADAARAPAGAT